MPRPPPKRRGIYRSNSAKRRRPGVGGLSFEEIARLSGDSLSKVYRSYQRGLVALRERLEGSCLTTKIKTKIGTYRVERVRGVAASLAHVPTGWTAAGIMLSTRGGAQPRSGGKLHDRWASENGSVPFAAAFRSRRLRPSSSGRREKRRWAWPTAFSGMTAVAAALLVVLVVQSGSQTAVTPGEQGVAGHRHLWSRGSGRLRFPGWPADNGLRVGHSRLNWRGTSYLNCGIECFATAWIRGRLPVSAGRTRGRSTEHRRVTENNWIVC